MLSSCPMILSRASPAVIMRSSSRMPSPSPLTTPTQSLGFSNQPGPGWFEKPKDWVGVVRGEGDGIREEDRMITAGEALDKIIGQLDNMIESAERTFGETESAQETTNGTTQV